MDKESDTGSLIGKINKHPLAGTDYFSCIQCGRCVGSCPATLISEKFNMRVFNKRILDGDETLLADETIWDYFYCQACVNLCARDNIDSYKTIIILRDMALERGHSMHHMKNIVPIMNWYLEKGVLTEASSWLSPAAIDEVCNINDITGITGRVRELKKESNTEQGEAYRIVRAKISRACVESETA